MFKIGDKVICKYGFFVYIGRVTWYRMFLKGMVATREPLNQIEENKLPDFAEKNKFYYDLKLTEIKKGIIKEIAHEKNGTVIYRVVGEGWFGFKESWEIQMQ